MRISLFLTAAAIICSWTLPVDKPPQSEAVPAPSIEAVLQSMRVDNALKHASWGVCIRRLSDGAIMSEHDPNRRLLPASTMKVLTTAVALETLGADYRFETLLQYSGQRDTSTRTLNGDIIIMGGGDPTLGSNQVEGSVGMSVLIDLWVSVLKAAGITRVNGSVVGDGSFFEDELPPSSWAWNDLGNYYAAAASGLTIADNTYKLTFTSPTGAGAATRITGTDPSMPEITFVNEVLTGAAGSHDEAYIHGSPLTYLRFIRGTIPPGRGSFTIKGSLPDPALFAADQLRSALIASGIEVVGEAKTHRDATFQPDVRRMTLLRHASPRLIDIVTRVNEESDNLYAEHLLKMIGKTKKGRGTTLAGLQVIKEFIAAMGIDSNAFNIDDGSGLSRSNTISAGALSASLVETSKLASFKEFKQSLAVSGQSGTLKSVCNGTVAAGRIYGKSGSLKSVRCYAGYFTSLSGEEYAFAMLANYFSGSSQAMKQKWEKLMVEMVKMK